MDKCAQYVNDIGIAAHTAEELFKNIDWYFSAFKVQV